MIISVATSDQIMWNKDAVIVDLVDAMIHNQPIVIKLLPEGPCAESLELYKILDMLCMRFNFDQSQITVQTCNMLEHHANYRIEYIPQMKYLRSAHQYSLPNCNKIFDNNFKHFGHFIGHGNRLRLRLASKLYKHCADQSLQTYHTDPTQDYHKPFIGIEELLYHGYPIDQIQDALDLIAQGPIVNDTINSYPILDPVTLNITKLYPNFFVEIVSLTYFTGNTFYLDEKIWRPILMRTPFMVQGPQNFFKNLHKLGFETFSKYWDEGYSEDSLDWQCNGIVNNINDIAHMSTSQLKTMYNNMKPILDHNYDRMMSLTAQDFEKFRNEQN